ncbi:MAG: DUF4127 family protein [Candidatus Wallbacteria bacterium]|nr:DUF4127 family protein [Candidatus Wallbacteria bacterium]
MARPLRIAYVPLDDRPVNLDAVLQLGRLAGAEVAVPPAELLGSFTRPGDTAALQGWVANLPAEVQQLIVSLDMLCYGGLLASRQAPTAGEEPEQPQSVLELLRELKNARSRLTITALSVLLRSSISVVRERDFADWTRIQEVATRPDATPQTIEPMLLSAGVEREIASAYGRARRRNLAIHRAAVELVEKGTLDYLLLCQEDAAPEGVHRHEQTELAERIAESELGGRVSIQPGADEGGMLLLARVALRHHGLGLAVQPRFGPGGPGAVPIYEDATLYDSLRAKLSVLGGRSGFGVHLYVHVLEEASDDLFLLQREGAPFEGFSAGLQRMGADWAVADASVANGADPQFVGQLLEQVAPLGLSSFSAWNTASNTLGGLLAHLAAREVGRSVLSPKDAAREHLAWLLTRFADDYLYQSLVRGRLARAAAERGWSVFELDAGARSELDALLSTELTREFQAFFERHSRRGGVAGFRATAARARFSLPWPRLFEVRARIAVDVA